MTVRVTAKYIVVQSTAPQGTNKASRRDWMRTIICKVECELCGKSKQIAYREDKAINWGRIEISFQKPTNNTVTYLSDSGDFCSIKCLRTWIDSLLEDWKKIK